MDDKDIDRAIDRAETVLEEGDANQLYDTVQALIEVIETIR